MAIGTGLALLGSAVISAGAGILSSKSQSKAANQAATISRDDNAANRSFLEGIYNRNVGYLSPWMRSGETANNAVMELLGYPQATPQPSAFASYPSAGTMPAFSGSQPIYYGGGQTVDGGEFAPSFGYSPYNFSPAPDGQFAPAMGQGAPPGTVTTPMPQASARSAFDAYRGSTGYDFRFGEGTRALQSAFSRNLESGAASKAAMRFGQGIASDEFGRYIDLLRGQSQMGMGSASALAGVGQQYGNTVTAGNTAAANAAANARLYAGNSQANMWSGLGSSFGSALGFLSKPGGFGF